MIKKKGKNRKTKILLKKYMYNCVVVDEPLLSIIRLL